MPTASELRSLSGEMPVAARAVQAWQQLRKAIGTWGAWYSVDFEDKLINVTVRALGGWRELCSKESEELNTWTRKEFERIYGMMAQSPGSLPEDVTRHLPGQFETNNVGAGCAVDPPKRIRMTDLRPLAKVERLKLVPDGDDDGKKAG